MSGPVPPLVRRSGKAGSASRENAPAAPSAAAAAEALDVIRKGGSGSRLRKLLKPQGGSGAGLSPSHVCVCPDLTRLLQQQKGFCADGGSSSNGSSSKQAPDRHAWSLLAVACAFGSPAMVDALLRAGADASWQRPDGHSALSAALVGGSSTLPEKLSLVHALLRAGAGTAAAAGWSADPPKASITGPLGLVLHAAVAEEEGQQATAAAGRGPPPSHDAAAVQAAAGALLATGALNPHFLRLPALLNLAALIHYRRPAADVLLPALLERSFGPEYDRCVRPGRRLAGQHQFQKPMVLNAA